MVIDPSNGIYQTQISHIWGGILVTGLETTMHKRTKNKCWVFCTSKRQMPKCTCKTNYHLKKAADLCLRKGSYNSDLFLFCFLFFFIRGGEWIIMHLFWRRHLLAHVLLAWTFYHKNLCKMQEFSESNDRKGCGGSWKCNIFIANYMHKNAWFTMLNCLIFLHFNISSQFIRYTCSISLNIAQLFLPDRLI